MRIAVLGGGGMMGCIAVQDLARSPAVAQVIVADRNVRAAQEVASLIGSHKVSVQEVDVRDRPGLATALREVDCCLNAVVYYYNLEVMAACLEARTHYVDLGGLFHTTRKQLALDDEFRAAGVSAVLGVGSAPGIPNVQSRYAVDQLDTVESIRILDGIRPPPPESVTFSYAVATIIDEMTEPPVVFRNGEFVTCEPLSEFEDYWFTLPLGLLPMHLSLHSEVATLPVSFADKGLRDCSFKINYWGMAPETVEKVKVLADLGFAGREAVAVGEQRVVPRELMVALMVGYVPPLASFLEPPRNQPPDWTKEIVTEVRGTRAGKTVTYRLGTLTVKGSLPTGVAPSIAAQWLAAGQIAPGVHAPEAALDPVPFFKELGARGIPTQVSVTEYL